MLFDWYADSDTPSRMSDGFRLGEPSARVFDALAGRVGAVVAGRNTYEDSDHFGGGSPHPTALLFVLSHRPAAEMTERQTLVTDDRPDRPPEPPRNPGQDMATMLDPDPQ